MNEYPDQVADERISSALKPIKSSLPWRKKRFQRAVKRLLDVGVSAPLLILVSPVLLATALMVRATSRGPVLLKQPRLGLDGVPFHMYKFRTMVATLPDGTTGGEAVVTRQDARLTPVGGPLRAWRLDELPQLWHVVKGEMSLVGPRPDVPGNVSLYRADQLERFAMPPGCTAWTFTRGAFANSWEARQDINAEYVRQWSVWLDVKILVGSFFVLVVQKDVLPEQDSIRQSASVKVGVEQ